MSHISRPVLILAVLLAGHANAADPRCVKLAHSYEYAEKTAALEWVIGTTDNSAPRAALHTATIGNTLLERQLNLSMMIALSCPLPDDPASAAGNAYFTPSIECRTAQIQGDGNSAKCDLSKWPRAPTK